MSHPLRMRGLKPKQYMIMRTFCLSHPLRMRGLKLLNPEARKRALVASFTDAWIETKIIDRNTGCNGSHPLRMRGLKQKVMFN